MAMESQGVEFFWSSQTDYTTYTTGVTSLVGEVTDFTGPGGAAAIIDVTHLGSTAKEKLPGLPDEGQLSLTLNFMATDVGQLELRTDRAARTKKGWVLKFRDDSSAQVWGAGYCLNYSIAGAVDDKITASCVIEIDGPVSYTTIA